MTMGKIVRAPEECARKDHDLIVVGGGVYGIMLTLEATRRGLRPLLLEREDFGGQTSFNHLRIVHGGLRYLQTMDLHRFRESVGERSWFLRTFPGRVRRLPCLMPLYGDGLRRPEVMAVALWLNDRLSTRRNQGVAEEEHLLDGKVLSPEETRARFPNVDMEGLRGAALWHDAIMPDSHRLLIDTLRWACGNGAAALNYMAAEGLKFEQGRVTGVAAKDRESGKEVSFRSPVVINAGGPWCREVAGRWDRDVPGLFQPSLAWNVLFDLPPLSDHALAVAPRNPRGHTYFLVPWKGRLLAGTGHVPWAGEIGSRPKPSPEQHKKFISDLNLAVPGLEIQEGDVNRIFSGLLPARTAGSATLGVREVIQDHGAYGGPPGLWSVSGVKFTTSRLVAEKLLNRIFPSCALDGPLEEIVPESPEVRKGLQLLPTDDPQKIGPALQALQDAESARTPEDLALRRLRFGDEFPESYESFEKKVEAWLSNVEPPNEGSESLPAASVG